MEDFPRYAPEQNPDEGVWGWLKRRLANLAAESKDHLFDALLDELFRLKSRTHLLDSFIAETKLPLLL